MPKRRYFSRRGKNYRKSFWVNLFEVDKMCCTIQVLKGIPLLITKNWISQRGPDQEGQPGETLRNDVALTTIPSHICAAKRHLKGGAVYMKSAFLEPPDDFATATEVIGDGALTHYFMQFLVRYYVPTRLHYLMWETYSSSPDISLESRIVKAYHNLVSFGAQALPECVNVINDVFNQVLPLTEPYTSRNIFYPVNKLVGFRVSNLLKRCGVQTLLYPYPLEPMFIQKLRAETQAQMFHPSTFINVGTKGLKKLAGKTNDEDEAGTILSHGEYTSLFAGQLGEDQSQQPISNK